MNEPQAMSSMKFVHHHSDNSLRNFGNTSLSTSGWMGGRVAPLTTEGTLSGNCSFPLGIVEFNNNNAIEKELPAGRRPFPQGEVFRGVESIDSSEYGTAKVTRMGAHPQ